MYSDKGYPCNIKKVNFLLVNFLFKGEFFIKKYYWNVIIKILNGHHFFFSYEFFLNLYWQFKSLFHPASHKFIKSRITEIRTTSRYTKNQKNVCHKYY